MHPEVFLRLFSNAIVRIPGTNFADGLTTVDLGTPILNRVLVQHVRYCEALQECGLVLTTLEPDLDHPDSTFVEDTAVLTARGAVVTRPGAESRQGEVKEIRRHIHSFYASPLAIQAPGTVDGGDICETEGHFLIGISHRTNEEGARQLADHLSTLGYTSSAIDVRKMSILHLKSGVSYIGDNTMVVIEEMADHEQFREFDLIRVSVQENYAANCVRVNDLVLAAAGFPHFTSDLAGRGFVPLLLDMSEFRKMDGGLSCLSLRF
jgi:dimethylargininase